MSGWGIYRSEYTAVVGAVMFARARHLGHPDKAGRPSIEHPLVVMAMVAPVPVLMAIAALHDVVEDGYATLDEIAVQFGERITAAVDAISRRKAETYKQYVERCVANKDATRVKLADVIHNASPSRCISGVLVDGQPMEKWHAAMVRARYEPTRKRLEAALGEYEGMACGCGGGACGASRDDGRVT